MHCADGRLSGAAWQAGQGAGRNTVACPVCRNFNAANNGNALLTAWSHAHSPSTSCMEGQHSSLHTPFGVHNREQLAELLEDAEIADAVYEDSVEVFTNMTVLKEVSCGGMVLVDGIGILYE